MRMLKLTLLNHNLSIETDATEADVQRVSALVQGKINEIIAQAPRSAPAVNIALMTCLQMAEELHRAKEDAKQAQAKLEQIKQDFLKRQTREENKLQEIIAQLDTHLR